MDQILPPPPAAAKSRNVSMNSNMSSYRSRPNPASQFSNAKCLFESFNTPAIRNGVSQLAKNPLAQKAAIALAKNDTIRTAAVNTACKTTTGNEPDSLVNKMAHASIKNMVQQFESKPIMGMGQAATTCADPPSQPSMSNFNLMPDNSYKHLTATQIDPFENPPQLPSSSSYQPAYDSFANRSKSTEPFSYGNFLSDFQQKKPAPSRPPPPKISNSWSNPSLSSPETFTNKAHAIARYPYKTSNADELSFDAGDMLLMKSEYDNQWVSAVNTRTGMSGIVPISFLDIKIPLAPISAVSFQQPSIPSPTTTAPTLSNSKQVMKALYDYHSDVEGDLNVRSFGLESSYSLRCRCASFNSSVSDNRRRFNAGELIVVYEAVNNEWYNGELHGKFGIFPASYVQSTSTSSAPRVAASKTVTALYDYSSGIAEDLQFSANDVIEVVEELNTEWIKGSLKGKVGLVPLTYVRRS